MYTENESTKTERARNLVGINRNGICFDHPGAIVNALESETLKEDPDLK